MVKVWYNDFHTFTIIHLHTRAQSQPTTHKQHSLQASWSSHTCPIGSRAGEPNSTTYSGSDANKHCRRQRRRRRRRRQADRQTSTQPTPQQPTSERVILHTLTHTFTSRATLVTAKPAAPTTTVRASAGAAAARDVHKTNSIRNRWAHGLSWFPCRPMSVSVLRVCLDSSSCVCACVYVQVYVWARATADR